jgi:hypothetical protein
MPDTGGPTPSKWVISAGGSGRALGRSIAVDGSGNSYITGNFNGVLIFGSTALTSTGATNLFVAKVDKDGNFLWAATTGGTSLDRGHSIAVDGAGNTYITGYFMDAPIFGRTLLTSWWSTNIFVAKLDNSGNFLWAVSAGGKSGSSGNSIAVDSAGNSYVTGYIQGSATFGSTTFSSKGFDDLFVAKLDQGGRILWAISTGGTLVDRGNSIAVDASGNSYITGVFARTVPFVVATLSASGSDEIFVAKVDNNGNFRMATSAGGLRPDVGYSIAVDSLGNSFITGLYMDKATFGTTTLTAKGYDDIFVAMLDKSGNFISAVSAGGTVGEVGNSIAVDGYGNSYLTGAYLSSATFGTTILTSRGSKMYTFVAKLNKGGQFISAVSGGGVMGSSAYSIALGKSGHSYITGWFDGTATFGSVTLTTMGTTDVFVAKLGKDSRF